MTAHRDRAGRPAVVVAAVAAVLSLLASRSPVPPGRLAAPLPAPAGAATTPVTPTVALADVIDKLAAARPDSRVGDRAPNAGAVCAKTVWLRPGAEADVNAYATAADLDAYISLWHEPAGRSAYLQVSPSSGPSWTVQTFTVDDAELVDDLLGGVTLRATG